VPRCIPLPGERHRLSAKAYQVRYPLPVPSIYSHVHNYPSPVTSDCFLDSILGSVGHEFFHYAYLSKIIINGSLSATSCFVVVAETVKSFYMAERQKGEYLRRDISRQLCQIVLSR